MFFPRNECICEGNPRTFLDQQVKHNLKQILGFSILLLVSCWDVGRLIVLGPNLFVKE